MKAGRIKRVKYRTALVNRLGPMVSCLLFCFAAMGQGGAGGDRQHFVTDKIRIGGLVDHPGTVDADSLKKMAVYAREDIKVTGGKGELKKSFRSVRGVLLKDLVQAAGIQMPNPKDKGKFYIRVTASDGYTVLFAYNELFYNTTGINALVLFEEDGEPIREDGYFVVICLSDTLTGPRHVKWVRSIEVGKLD